MHTLRPGTSDIICFVPHFGHSTGVCAGAMEELCASLTLSIAFAYASLCDLGISILPGRRLPPCYKAVHGPGRAYGR